MVEQQSGTADQLAGRARDLEIGLIDALRAGDKTRASIGRDAGPHPQAASQFNLLGRPSDVGDQDIRGIPEAYFGAIPALRRDARNAIRTEDQAAAHEESHIANWRAGLPPARPI